MYSRTFEILDDVVRESREDLSTYRDILEISDRVKKSEYKKILEKKNKSILRGYSFGVKDYLKDVECYKCHKKGHYANKYPEINAKDAQGPLKVRNMKEENIKEDHEKKSISLIRVLYSDLKKDTKNPL